MSTTPEHGMNRNVRGLDARNPALPVAAAVFRPGLIALGLLAMGVARAENLALNNGTDPTRLTSKFIATFEHVNLKGGVGSDVLKLNYMTALPGSYSVGVKLPVSRLTDWGGRERFDLGDASVSLTHVFGLSKEGGNVLIGELNFDTAARPELGTGRTVFKGTYVKAWFLASGHIFAPAAVQEISVDRSSARADVNRTTFDFYYVPKLADPHNLLTYDPSLVLDWESNKNYAALALTYGRMVGKAYGGNAIVTVKPTVFAGGDRPGTWGLELGLKLIGF